MDHSTVDAIHEFGSHVVGFFVGDQVVDGPQVVVALDPYSLAQNVSLCWLFVVCHVSLKGFLGCAAQCVALPVVSPHCGHPGPLRVTGRRRFGIHRGGREFGMT